MTTRRIAPHVLIAALLLTCVGAMFAPQAHAETLRRRAPLTRGWTQPIYDQGATGYCTGYASILALAIATHTTPPETLAVSIGRDYLTDPITSEVSVEFVRETHRNVTVYPDVAAALRTGRVVVLPIWLTPSFEYLWWSPGPITFTGPHPDGAHEIVAQQMPGGRAIVWNSWGPSWGDHGHAIVNLAELVANSASYTNVTGTHPFSIG